MNIASVMRNPVRIFARRRARDAGSLLRRGALCVALALLAALPVSAADVSTLEPGETVVLLPGAAYQSADGHDWLVPLHAWVYVPQQSTMRRGMLAKLLRLGYGLNVTPATAPYFDARINLLLANNQPGRTIVVDVAGTRVTLPPTKGNGHARTQIKIPVSADTPDGARLTVRAVLPPSDTRKIETAAQLIGPAGLSVISDIDDTVKVTDVLDHRRMWEATFFKPFKAVGGMSDAYRRLASTGATFHYVSSSPWHLAEPLMDFLRTSDLPLSSLALKQIRLKDRTALNITKPGRETKPPQIAAILATYPNRRFILIGDSGEDDPEVYAEALRQHPQQIARIYIRNVTSARRDDTRFAKTFTDIEAARWVLFNDPGEIGAP